MADLYVAAGVKQEESYGGAFQKSCLASFFLGILGILGNRTKLQSDKWKSFNKLLLSLKLL